MWGRDGGGGVPREVHTDRGPPCPPISPSLQADVQEEAGWERRTRRGVALRVKPQGSGGSRRPGGPLSQLLDPRRNEQRKRASRGCGSFPLQEARANSCLKHTGAHTLPEGSLCSELLLGERGVSGGHGPHQGSHRGGAAVLGGASAPTRVAPGGSGGLPLSPLILPG